MQLSKKSKGPTGDLQSSATRTKFRVEKLRSRFENLTRNFVYIFKYFSQIQAVNEAHRVLMDPVLRDTYDQHGLEGLQIYEEQCDGQDDAYRARARVCFLSLFIGKIKYLSK